MSKRTEDLEKQIAALEVQLEAAETARRSAILRLDMAAARAHDSGVKSLTSKIARRKAWLEEAKV